MPENIIQIDQNLLETRLDRLGSAQLFGHYPFTISYS